jgi:uncharacterized protein (TIGR03435 family)
MTYGSLRPTLVLPIDAETWSDEELRRALVHELEHIRRADWLTQCMVRVLCAVYWFHPLVWIARRELVLEAERACDDAVLRYSEASEYADQLVDLAKRLSTRHQPYLAMANRRDLAARVRALLDGRLPRGRAGAWLVAAVSCLAAVLVLVMSPMRVVAESPQAIAAGDRPHFDVVSVKPCDPKAPPPTVGRSTAAGQASSPTGGRGMSAGQASPGRFRLDCRSVSVLIDDAYVKFAGGHLTSESDRPRFDSRNVEPEWIRSEKFTIEATTGDAIPLSVMQGPMLQAVLEDRFKVKTHRETRDVPVYELVIAKGGSKLTPFTPGTCVPRERGTYPAAPLAPGQRRCYVNTEQGANGNWVENVEAMTLDDWAAGMEPWLADHGEGPIVNKTGITGLQTFRHEYSGRWEDFAAEIKNQLGLELRPGRGSREFLILDHVERPVPDADVVPPPAPAARGGDAPTTTGQAAQSSNTGPQGARTFDVASIRPCATQAAPLGTRGQSSAQASPGTLSLSCVSLRALINTAYGSELLNRPPATTADGPQLIRGGPSWAYSETFTIETKASGVADRSTLIGPLLRSLLEDRFQLKMHRATEQQSMYALTVAKGGLKIKPITPGECVEFRPGDPPRPEGNNTPTCGVISGNGWGSVKGFGVWLGGSNAEGQAAGDSALGRSTASTIYVPRSNAARETLPARSERSPRFVDWLFSVTRRTVLDRTGLSGRYNLALEFTPDNATPGVQGRCGGSPDCIERLAAYGRSDERPATFGSGATIFKALEALGLELQPIKASAEYIVIDHAERPTAPDGTGVTSR